MVQVKPNFSLFDKLSDGYLILDGKFTVMYLNQSFSEWLNATYDSKILPNQSIYQNLSQHSELLKIIKQQLPLVMRHGEQRTVLRNMHGVFTLRAFSLENVRGIVRWVAFEVKEETVIIKLNNADDTNQENDIIARQKKFFTLQQELQLRNVEFETIAESVPLLIWGLNRKGIIYYCNNKTLKYTGLRQEDFLDNKWRFLLHPQDDGRVTQLFNKLSNLKAEQLIEFRLRRKDGQFRWFQTRFTPVFDNGKIIRWYATATDIHDRVLAQEVTHAKAQEFHVINETIPQLVWTAIPYEGFNYYNQNMINYFGMEELANSEMGWLPYVHPAEREQVLEEWSKSINKGEAMEFEARLRHCNHNYYWFLIRAVPLKKEDQQVVKWYGTLTDIDERKRSEMQKDDFINIASHELKTPLTSIKAYLQLALRAASGKTKLGFIQNALRVANRLNKLIVNLLELSQIENKQDVVIPPQTVLLDRLIYYVAEDFENTTNRNIIVKTEKDIKVTGQPNQIEQILGNLISNAVKYSTAGKPIRITTRKIANDFVEIAISDEGKGIATHQIQHLFERFYRVNEGTNATGLGLGLYICKKLVEEHEGRIWVESKLGEGSCFYFTLPLQ